VSQLAKGVYVGWRCLAGTRAGLASPFLLGATGRTDDAGGAGEDGEAGSAGEDVIHDETMVQVKLVMQVNHSQHPQRLRTQSARPVSDLTPSWGGCTRFWYRSDCFVARIIYHALFAATSRQKYTIYGVFFQFFGSHSSYIVPVACFKIDKLVKTSLT